MERRFMCANVQFPADVGWAGEAWDFHTPAGVIDTSEPGPRLFNGPRQIAGRVGHVFEEGPANPLCIAVLYWRKRMAAPKEAGLVFPEHLSVVQCRSLMETSMRH